MAQWAGLSTALLLALLIPAGMAQAEREGGSGPDPAGTLDAHVVGPSDEVWELLNMTHADLSAEDAEAVRERLNELGIPTREQLESDFDYWVLKHAISVLGEDAFADHTKDTGGASSHASLYRQIQDGVENRHLECGRPDHHMAVRQGLQLACITGESASRLGWPGVSFSASNDMLVNYTSLGVKADGKEFQIGARLENGVVQKAWRGDGFFGLFLEINSADEGKARLEIPGSFFTAPEKSFGHRVTVLENSEEIPSDVESGQDGYVVEFQFSDTDPEIGVLFE